MRRCAAALALGTAAGSAAAHSPIPGIGIFYSGAAHPFVSPAHLIALLALGLAIGQRAQARGDFAPLRAPLTVLGLGLAAGLLLAAAAVLGDPDTDRALLVLAAATALAVVIARPLPTAALGLVAYVGVMVSVAQRAWLRIAVRVAGSWIAAAALLVLALSLAPPR